jgi:ubiquinone/menaquinone biosynthesis C-methylase UbiE
MTTTTRALDSRATVPDPVSLDPKTANVVYHDWEAASYDGKWSISFDDRCIRYARERFLKVAPDRRYGRALEIGAGTGFFIINLWQAGFVGEPHATDISPGMVEVCLRNARDVGIAGMSVRTADAEALPFEDDSFDLVLGHAVVHHLPDVPAALREAYRVLRPGGALVVAGEPTRLGYQIVRAAKRATALTMRNLGRGLGLVRAPAPESPQAALEAHVDLHEFHPHVVRGWLRAAGFTNLRIETEELLSGMFGWSVRTIESLARPGLLGPRWAWFAYRNYLRLAWIDANLMRRVVPKPLFYNLLFSAEKPAK